MTWWSAARTGASFAARKRYYLVSRHSDVAAMTPEMLDKQFTSAFLFALLGATKLYDLSLQDELDLSVRQKACLFTDFGRYRNLAF
jgi:hypothetical protein